MIKIWETFQDLAKRFNPCESQNIQSRCPLVSHGYSRRPGLKRGFTGAGSLSICQHRGVLVNLSEKEAKLDKSCHTSSAKNRPACASRAQGKRRTEEREGRRMAVWHDQFNLHYELHAGARPAQKCAQSEEGEASGQSQNRANPRGHVFRASHSS